MTYSRVDYVSDLLEAANPSAEWGAAGIDRARELAQILIDSGITDLSKLQLQVVSVGQQQNSWSPIVRHDEIVLIYNGRHFGYLGTPDRRENGVTLERGTMVAWSAVGHGNVGYHVVSASGGFAFAPYWASSSDASDVREMTKIAAIMIVSFALPVAGVALGNVIGAAVLGPTLAASYPALATAIGNVALATVFSGGDIKAAVSGAALAFVAGYAGQMASVAAVSASDVALIGDLADTATRVAIRGGDVKTAVLTTAIVNGAPIMFEGLSPVETIDVSQYPGTEDIVPISTFEPGYWQPDPVSLPAVEPHSYGSLPDIPLESPYAPNYAPIPDLAEPAMPAKTDPFRADDSRPIINTISDAAKAALGLVAAYQNAKRPAIVNTSRVVGKNGSTVALDTGVIQSRDATGRVINERPVVGKPQSTVSGSVIVNNGDGTYTLVSPTGQTRRINYGDNTGTDSALSSLPWPLLIGGAGVLIALFK